MSLRPVLAATVKCYRPVGNRLKPVAKIPPGGDNRIGLALFIDFKERIVPSIIHAGHRVYSLVIPCFNMILRKDEKDKKQNKNDCMSNILANPQSARCPCCQVCVHFSTKKTGTHDERRNNQKCKTDTIFCGP